MQLLCGLMGETADRLTAAMQRRGLDQSALARRLGVSQGSISKIVLGRTTNSRLLPRIAVQLGVSVPWLLGETDDPSSGAPEAELPADEEGLLFKWRQLPPDDKQALMQILDRMISPRTVHEARERFRHKGE